MSDRSTRHDDDEPKGVPFGGSGAPSRGSSDYVPVGDLSMLSSAPLSSELESSESSQLESSQVEPSDESSGGDDSGAEAPSEASSLEAELAAMISALEQVTKERDGYLEDTQRVAAEFANFRRQNDKRQIEVIEQAAASLAERLLPVLDACDGALAHGAADVEPIYNMLIATLEKSGLSVLRPLGDPFDPHRHEAVIHEEGEGDGPHIAEVLRTGYLWNGRVLRPALVKVRD
ncbi:MAG TPA: nucleotide exchange factor GrpE [Acidimicrobiales bacterium]|nr:nucleotide exchange factor GrpE [Acidimicrobiales bacterium]